MKHYKIRTSILNNDSKALDLYFKDVRKYKLLTPEQESEINKRILEGDDKAREELVLHNLRICISIAKQYQGKGIPLEDLVSIANCGLIKASKKYNPENEVKFISYAVWWIRDAILKEILNYSKPIRIPTEKITRMNKINRISSEFEQENYRLPSIFELSELIGLDEDTIKEVMSQCNVNMISETVQPEEGDSESLFDTLYIEDSNTDKIVKSQSTKTSILDFLKSALNDMEFEVITRYFGIIGPETPLDVIGEQNNITKERVRQIKDKAIIKLRKNDNVFSLANFL